MRHFLLSSMLVFGGLALCFPADAQTSGTKSKSTTVTRSSSEHEDIKVINGTFTTKGKNGQTIIINTTNDGGEIKLITEGKVTLSDDERAILAISPDGRFEYSRKAKGGPDHKIELTSDKNGELTGRFWVNNNAQDYETAGKAWLAVHLPEIVNSTGLGAEERAERLYKQGGVKAILDYTDKLAKGTGRTKMYRHAMDQADFSAANLKTMLDQVAKTKGSDYETSSLLLKIKAEQLAGKGVPEAYLGAVRNMSSDYEKSRVLRHLLSQDNLSDAALTQIAESATTIGSDYEKRRLLSTLAARPQLNEKQFGFVVKALQNVASDYERAKGLSSFMKHEQQMVKHFDQVLPLISHMDSDYEKARAYNNLLSNSQLGAAQYLPLLKASEGIDSDYEKARVLRKVAPKLSKSDSRLLEAYASAAKTVKSKYEYDRVMAALK